MNRTVVITGAGRDRVGIVAELTEFLYRLGCNLLDSSMTLLRGEFALILMATLPADLTIEAFRKSLLAKEKDLGLMFSIRELTQEELAEDRSEGNTFIVSVYGADRCGIVAGVTKAIAALGVNITDVETKSTKQEGKEIYVMILELHSRSDMTAKELEQGLFAASKDLAVDLTVQELEIMEL